LSAQLATLARGVLAGLVFTAVLSLAVALVRPVASRWMAAAHPARRARAAWLLAVLPGLVPAFLVALCFAPGALAALGLLADHCGGHPEHAHLCFAHARGALTPALAGLLVVAVGGLAVAGAREAVGVARARRWISRAQRGAVALAPDVVRIESRAPFSVAAGLLRPRVLVASALSRALPAAQLDAVIEHERAHARRRDPLARLAARALSWGHLPAVRRELLAELALASEQACDAEAALRVGDRLVVAEAILAVERLLAEDPREGPGLASFGGSATAERIRELLAPERPAPRRRGSRLAAAALGAAALLAADPLHHATEHLLGLLARFLAA
jgi:beta-lactamase regulating signal transducer with metallopeptidase domain